MSDDLKPDTDGAISFLEWLRPAGPWLLSAKRPDGPFETRFCADVAAAREWIEARNGRFNLYVMINPAIPAADKKACKEDVSELAFLHVDLDVKQGPLEEGLAGIRARLADFAPRPSGIIFSGGGYWAFWRLDEPLYLGGAEAQIAEAELYNRQLEIVLGGDHCFNVDRVCRIPGTINLPDKAKRDRGRTSSLATIVELRPGHHPLHDFTPAPEVQKAKGSSSSSNRVKISGNLPRLKDLDELPEEVTQRTRMLIVQGDDPDDPTRYGSKSEVMWAVVCELVRAGCDDDIIAAVLLDPDLGISDHPLRQKRSVEYVARQIERAREEVVEPMLRKLNEQHAVIEMYGGKCRVISHRASEVDPSRQELVPQSFEDFRNRYMHIKVQVGTTKDGNPLYAPAGKWWLENPMRRQYRSVVFRPNAETEDGEELNLWKGLAVKPKAGEWSLLRQLIEEVLAAGDPRASAYILRWAAFTVQYPERPAEVALVLRGGKGTGKSTFGHVMRRLFGQHGTSIASSHVMTNNFNKPLHDCCLLFADEALARGDAKAEGIIKALITEPTVMIEPKGVDAFPAPNRLKVIIASNEDWVVSASADERRFAVFDVASHFAAPPGSAQSDERGRWWAALNAELDGGGLEAFLYDLLAMDLGGWHPRYDVPQNDALVGQKAASLRGLDRVLYDILCAGTVPVNLHVMQLSDDSFVVATEELQKYCAGLARRFDPTSNAVSYLLGAGRKVRGGKVPRPGLGFAKREYPRPKGWVWPPLIEARRRWDEAFWPGEWDASPRWSLDEDDGSGAGNRSAEGNRDDAPY